MAESGDRNNILEGRMVPLTSVLSNFECTICLEVVKVPLKQCSNGHLICCSCMTNVKECPRCEVSVFHENSTSIKNLLESLPRICQYSANGCKFVVEVGDKHEIYCGFRSMKCLIGCGDKVLICKLLEHFKTKHDHTSFEPKGVTNWYDMAPSEPEIVCTFDGHIFWLVEKEIKINNDITFYEYNFFMIPIGQEPEKDYFIRLQFKKNNEKITYVLKASNGENQNHKRFPALLTEKSIEWFREEESIWFHYEIFSKPK